MGTLNIAEVSVDPKLVNRFSAFLMKNSASHFFAEIDKLTQNLHGNSHDPEYLEQFLRRRMKG